MPADRSSSSAERRRPVVLFDLDGTLIDSLELLIASMHHAFDSWNGRRPTEEEWVATIGRPLVWQFGQYASTEEEVQSLVRTYRTFQHQHHDRLTTAFPGIPALVRRLHDDGHPLGVVTSKGDQLAHRSLEHVGLAQYFPVIVGADRTTRRKPAPDPIWLALEELGAARDESVYIGDSPFDTISANAAGVLSIGVTWGASTEEKLRPGEPRHVVSSVAALDEILLKLRDGFGT